MRGRNPTLKQKMAIKAAGLIPDNWLVLKVFSREIEVAHKHTGTIRVVRL